MIELNGKGVDVGSLVVLGIDRNDYPDFCDAYFSEGYYTSGELISDEDLDRLKDLYPEVFYDVVQNQLVY